jgi:hypothetical protein
MISPLSIAKIVVVVAVLAVGFCAGWTLNGWRYEAQLATANAAYEANMKTVSDTAAAAAEAQVAKTTDLQNQLAAEDAKHTKEMTDVQAQIAAAQAAVALPSGGLSVLATCPSTDTGSGNSVPSTPTASIVVHAAHVAAPTRAVLDRGVAQRLLALTATGDKALVALSACQDYVKTIQGTSK